MFHADVVRPLLAPEAAPASLCGRAAGVGFGCARAGRRDQPRPRLGCRLTLLVDEPDSGVVPQVSELLERELPETYQGHRVRFPVTWDNSRSHRVEVATVGGFAASRMGVDPGVVGA